MSRPLCNFRPLFDPCIQVFDPAGNLLVGIDRCTASGRLWTMDSGATRVEQEPAVPISIKVLYGTKIAGLTGLSRPSLRASATTPITFFQPSAPEAVSESGGLLIRSALSENVPRYRPADNSVWQRPGSR